MAEKGKTKKETAGYSLKDEIIVIAALAVAIYLFLCNFRIGGSLGMTLSDVMFGVFGLRAYIAPVLALLAVLLFVSNAGNAQAVRKIAAGVVLFFYAVFLSIW